MPKIRKPKVGVVILTYNSEDFIEKCLRSVMKSDYSNYICIVVDNNSTDKTTDIVQKKFPKVNLIKNRSNVGYAKGNNIGISYFLKKLDISYILILNPDTLVDNKLITELVNFMESSPSAAVAGPIITYANLPGTIWFAGGIFNKLFCYTKHPYMNKKFIRGEYRGLHTNTYPRYTAPYKNSKKTDFVTGACMMVKTAVFKKVGLLPQDYFMYFEDVDFCQKVIKAGYSCYLLAKPLVKHYVSSSAGMAGSNTLTPLRAYFYARNPFIYIKKNVKGSLIILNYFGQFFIRLPYFGIQILTRERFISLIYYLKGIIDGILWSNNIRSK